MRALHGSFQNRMMEGKQEIIPEVGMGATELGYSDRNPYTIVEIISKNKIVVQADDAENVGEVCYDQNWKITPNPNGHKKTLIQTKKGWKVFKGCTRFIIGHREKYYDYEF